MGLVGNGCFEATCMHSLPARPETYLLCLASAGAWYCRVQVDQVRRASHTGEGGCVLPGLFEAAGTAMGWLQAATHGWPLYPGAVLPRQSPGRPERYTMDCKEGLCQGFSPGSPSTPHCPPSKHPLAHTQHHLTHSLAINPPSPGEHCSPLPSPNPLPAWHIFLNAFKLQRHPPPLPHPFTSQLPSLHILATRSPPTPPLHVPTQSNPCPFTPAPSTAGYGPSASLLRGQAARGVCPRRGVHHRLQGGIILGVPSWEC